MTGKHRTAAATAAVIRRGQESAANRLRAEGWVCIAPDDETAVYVTDAGQVWCDLDPCVSEQVETPGEVRTLHYIVSGIIQHMAEHQPTE